MANPSETLNRLVIRSECRTPWEQMTGDDVRRFCEECEREVFDFARLSPTQIRAHLQASRGRLCARLTRQDGRLVMAREPELPPPAPPLLPRYGPALTAGLVAACLGGAGAGMARAAEPAASAVSAPVTSAVDSPAGQAAPEPAPARQETARQETAASGAIAGRLHGSVTAGDRPLEGVTVVARNRLDGEESSALTGADGAFTFSRLRTGMYEIEGTREGFAIEAQTVTLQPGRSSEVGLRAEPQDGGATLGVLYVPAEPLRKEFDASDLVVVAVVGPSAVVGRADELIEVSTALQVEQFIKGTFTRGEVPYRHSEQATGTGELGPWRAELTPGTRVLALLARARTDGAVRGKPAFEIKLGSDLRRLDDAEGDAYVSRLEALARLERQFARRGETDPADLMEWLVATAEDPSTRREATGELESALLALASHAAEERLPADLAGEHLKALLERFHADGGRLRGEPPAELLGAFLTAGQRKRLTAALLATDRLDAADRDLFVLVRRWDEKAAREWLLRQLRTTPGPGVEAAQPWMFVDLAGDLEDDALRQVAAAGIERQQEIAARWPPDDPAQDTRTLYQQKLAELEADLRRDFAAALAKGQSPRP